MEMRTQRQEKRRSKGMQDREGSERSARTDGRDANCCDWLYSRTTFDSHTLSMGMCVHGNAQYNGRGGYLQTATREIILIVRSLQSRSTFIRPLMQNHHTPFTQWETNSDGIAPLRLWFRLSRRLNRMAYTCAHNLFAAVSVFINHWLINSSRIANEH